MIVLTATGRVGKDAELRSTNSGEKILSFSVGSDMGFGQNKTTIWLDCSIWGKRGESLAPYILKGASVTVIGEFGQRSYQNKQGETVTATTIKVLEVALQGGGQQQEPRNNYRVGTTGPAPQSPPRSNSKPAFNNDDLDDEIPF
jgi:single-strand DNA-binding protein